MATPRPLVSELLRPQQLGDLTLPRRDINRLQRMIDEDDVMNMLFYGKPGLGKTSAARLIAKGLGEYGWIEINGSDATGVDFVRNRIGSFARSGSLLADHRKICFIDEAEYLSKSAQAALRKLVEDTSNTCRFIFAVNDMSKIIQALQSRLVGVSFDVLSPDRAEVKERLLSRYVDVLSRMQITFDHERLVIPTFDLSPIRSSTNSAISPAGRRCLARGLMYCSKKSVSAPLRGVPKLQLSRLLRLVAIPIVVGRTLPFQEGVHSPVRDML